MQSLLIEKESYQQEIVCYDRKFFKNDLHYSPKYLKFFIFDYELKPRISGKQQMQ